MNDFFFAANRSLEVENIKIKQIEMRDFDSFLIIASPVKEVIKGEKITPELIKKLFLEHTVQVLSLCALTTGLDMKVLLIKAKDEQLMTKIIEASLLLYKPFFEEKPSTKKDKSESTWFDAFQFLISMGHQHSEIMNMSYGAFHYYLKAASKRYTDNNLALANMTRLAHASDKDFKKTTNEIKQ